jgi:hypothetical protein
MSVSPRTPFLAASLALVAAACEAHRPATVAACPPCGELRLADHARAADAPCPGGSAAALSPERPAEPAANVKIAAFDCGKAETPANQSAASCSANPSADPTPGIRGWNSGGPEGSVWNAGDLACRARVEVPCTGDLDVQLKVGRTELARVKQSRVSGSLDCSFSLPKARWSAELDRDGGLPFRTGIFRTEAYIVCTDPPAVLRADDHFVAGFAWGE